jgi:hypothetical protein
MHRLPNFITIKVYPHRVHLNGSTATVPRRVGIDDSGIRGKPRVFSHPVDI